MIFLLKAAVRGESNIYCSKICSYICLLKCHLHSEKIEMFEFPISYYLM